MELKEYYGILKANLSVVVYVAIAAVIIVYAWSVRVSETHSASLLLSISRTETQSSADYRYDQFYRLEADEKFAETVVQWLKSPGVAKDILEKAGLNADGKTMRQLEKSFRAEKLSSNLVTVGFSTQNPEEAAKIASAAEKVISEKTRGLNSDARDPNWFEVNMTDFVTLRNIQDLRINLGIAALAGIFAGMLLAFGKHYISEE